MSRGTSDSPYYRNFMDSEILSYLEVPCVARGKLCLQHDGAPPHYSREVKEFLNEKYELGRFGRN